MTLSRRTGIALVGIVALVAIALVVRSAGTHRAASEVPLGRPTLGLAQERTYHTATLLDPPTCSRPDPPAGYPCGELLVTGGAVLEGFSTNHIVDSAERYSPSIDRWRTAAPMHQPRVGHTATLLQDGRVLVAGGQILANGELQGSGSSELYDPVRNQWTYTDGPMNGARYFHTATLLDGPACRVETRPPYCGEVLVAGGTSKQHNRESLSATELFDPATRRWTPLPRLATARQSHTATLLADGRVLVAGGLGDGGISLSSAEVYDPPAARWTRTAPMGTARSFHAATLFGGPACEVAARPAYCGGVLVTGGLQAGQIEEYWQTGVDSASAELYDPDASDGGVRGVWRPASSMASAREGHQSVLGLDGQVVAVGGDHEASVEAYDPVTGKWRRTATLAGRRYDHTATVLDGPQCRAGASRGLAYCGTVVVAGGSPTGGHDEGPYESLSTTELQPPLS